MVGHTFIMLLTYSNLYLDECSAGLAKPSGSRTCQGKIFTANAKLKITLQAIFYIFCKLKSLYCIFMNNFSKFLYPNILIGAALVVVLWNLQ